MVALATMNIIKSIFGGSSAGPAQAARNPAAGKVPQPGAPAFSDHLQDPPEKTLAEKKADGEVATIAPTPKPIVHLHVGYEVIGRVVKGHENEILTKEDFDQAERLGVIDDRYNELIAANTDSSAKQNWKRQRRELHTHSLSGELDKLPNNSWTLDDFRQDAYQNRKQFKTSRRENRIGMNPVLARIAQRVKSLAAIEAEKLETEERAKASDWGVEFQPSEILLRVRYLSEHAEVIFPDAGAIPPRQLFACLGITNNTDK